MSISRSVRGGVKPTKVGKVNVVGEELVDLSPGEFTLVVGFKVGPVRLDVLEERLPEKIQGNDIRPAFLTTCARNAT